jgi:hypothetical protein
VPLSAQIDRLYTCYNALRRRPSWSTAVKGAAAFLEFKLAANGSDWHPHLHVLAEGTWLSQKDLSRTWYEITGDSSIVDIRSCHNTDQLAAYVVKYASKAADHSLWTNPDKLAESIAATRGRKLCSTSGTWRGVKLKPTKDHTHRWTKLYFLDELQQLCDQGNPQAFRIMNAIRPSWLPDSDTS